MYVKTVRHLNAKVNNNNNKIIIRKSHHWINLTYHVNVELFDKCKKMHIISLLYIKLAKKMFIKVSSETLN